MILLGSFNLLCCNCASILSFITAIRWFTFSSRFFCCCINNELPDSFSIIASIAARSIPSIPALSDADTTKSDMLNFGRVDGVIVALCPSSIVVAIELLVSVALVDALSDLLCNKLELILS